MGIYKAGAAGGFSGKTGTVVSSNWRKVRVMKGLPKQYPHDSPAQLAQQQKWRMMVAFIAPMISLFEDGFRGEDTGRKTVFNIALSYHLRYAVKKTEDGFGIDYPKVVFSKGKLPRTRDVELREGDNPCEYIISWPSRINSPLISDDDTVTLICLYPSLGSYKTSLAERKDGSLAVCTEKSLKGTAVHFYIFFTSPGGINSPSSYLGERVCE